MSSAKKNLTEPMIVYGQAYGWGDIVLKTYFWFQKFPKLVSKDSDFISAKCYHCAISVKPYFLRFFPFILTKKYCLAVNKSCQLLIFNLELVPVILFRWKWLPQGLQICEWSWRSGTSWLPRHPRQITCFAISGC